MRRKIAVLAVLGLILAGCGASESTDSENQQPAPGKDPGVVDTREDNTSTFALDVDTASYTYAARQLNDGRLPSPEQVRPEEFINSFNQRYAPPRGDGFAVHVDGSRMPAEHEAPQAERLLRVGLQTLGEDNEERKDANLTFVIDVSGSMDEPGRLDLVQDALRYLVDQLRPSDAVAIVTFSGRATVVREMTRVSNRDRLISAIDSMRTEGSTNLGEGLITGYQVARDAFREGATNRVILLSDGLANTGNTDADSLLRKIRGEADKEISLLGVGVGSDYGDALMEKLADEGDGFVVYVSERQQARDLFVRRLPATLQVRAYDAKAQVVFDKSTVESYQLIGYENRLIEDKDFRDNRVDGGEVGPGHSVTALYVVRLRPGANGRVATVRVRWLDPQDRSASEQTSSVATTDLAGDFAGAAPTLRLTYVAAYFAEWLRRRPSPQPAALAAITREIQAELEDPAVDDLAGLIGTAQRRG
jgi:Ca-activated chloride channel family protein